MPAPLAGPSTVSEEKARPQTVDYPPDIVESPLPVQETEAPNIRDTGYIFDQEMPGDTQPMPAASKPVLTANRVTEVSDNIIFGSAYLPPETAPYLLIPAHRDRLRVTIEAVVGSGEPPVFLGHNYNMTPGANVWNIQTGTGPIALATRGAIYVMTGPGTGSVFVQWAVEMVSEGCGCPLP